MDFKEYMAFLIKSNNEKKLIKALDNRETNKQNPDKENIQTKNENEKNSSQIEKEKDSETNSSSVNENSPDPKEVEAMCLNLTLRLLGINKKDYSY